MSQFINFPFFNSLPREAQMALEIASRMRNTGETIGQASKFLYEYSWSATRLANGLAKVTTTMSELGVASAEASELVAFGSEAAATAAGAGAGGGLVGFLTSIGEWLGLTGTAATAVGLALTMAALGGLTYLGSQYVGSKFGDTPVQSGPAMNKPKPPGVNNPTGQGSDKFAVWVLYISGETLYIGQESTLKSRPACQYSGGGLCGDGENPPPQYAKLEGDFDTYEEALAAYCRATGGAQPQPWPLTGDSKMSAYGHNLWTTGIACP